MPNGYQHPNAVYDTVPLFTLGPSPLSQKRPYHPAPRQIARPVMVSLPYCYYIINRSLIHDTCSLRPRNARIISLRLWSSALNACAAILIPTQIGKRSLLLAVLLSDSQFMLSRGLGPMLPDWHDRYTGHVLGVDQELSDLEESTKPP